MPAKKKSPAKRKSPATKPKVKPAPALNRDELERTVHDFCRDSDPPWSDPDVTFKPFKAGKIAQLLFHQKDYPNPGDQQIDIRLFAADLHHWLVAGDPGHPCKTNLATATAAVREQAAKKSDAMQKLFDVVANHYE